MAKVKSALTAVQAIRYRELMWIAQFGDFMSNTEFDELTKLMRLRGYKQPPIFLPKKSWRVATNKCPWVVLPYRYE